MNFNKIKSVLLFRCWKGIIGLGSLCIATAALANPVLNNVASGNVAIQQAPNVETIDQSSQKAILNWQSFNIGQQQATHFIQPAGGIALNRISPTAGASQIYGMLTATGQIILVNPAGINFGPNAVVNVGGLVATTANITDQNFLKGNYQFINAGPGAITNAGQLIAANHGLIALIGDNVTNNGLIKANLGNVVLASGNDTYTVNFGDNMINFALNGNGSGSVTNNGALIANGGQILVTADAAEGVLNNVINMNGVAEAKSVGMQNGEIILSGGSDGGIVNVTGKLNASGKKPSQTGGTVDITGYDILLNSPTLIDVSGDAGGGNVNIGGNEHGAGPLPNANATVMAPGAVINANAITTGNGGNIILWSEDATKAYGSISATGGSESGNGGFLETSSHNYLDVNGLQVNLSAPHGIAGTWLLDPSELYICDSSYSSNCSTTNGGSFNGGNPDIFTPSSSTSYILDTDLDNDLDSVNVNITTSSGDINIEDLIAWSTGTSLTLSAYHNIVNNSAILNTSGGNLNLIANNAGAYDVGGTDGIVINNGTIFMNGSVNIYYTPTSYTSPTSYTVSDGGILNTYMQINSANDLNTISQDSVTAGDTAVLGYNYVLTKNIDMSGYANFDPIGNLYLGAFTGIFNGQNHAISNLTVSFPDTNTNYLGLFGINEGTIENIQLLNANIIGETTDAGALVGWNLNGTINNAYVSGTITLDGGSNYIGGVAGDNEGAISNSGSGVNINGNGYSVNYVGGVAGQNETTGTIQTSYNSGNISADDGEQIGGLVGFNEGAISNSYSTGNVTGDQYVGGLAGYNEDTIANTYSTGYVTDTSGNDGGGLVGENTNAITNSFWDTTTSGQSSNAGVNVTIGAGDVLGGCIGCANNLLSQGTYSAAGWVIGTDPSTDTWVSINGVTRPMLAAEYTTNIATANQLQMIGLNATTLAGTYTLNSNVDASATGNSSGIWGSAGFSPIGTFTGVFNGNNYSISGLTINTPATSNVGLFSNVSGAGALVENLGLTNVNISGDENVGGITGELQGGAQITTSYVSGTIRDANGIAGGIVGFLQGAGSLLNEVTSSGNLIGNASNSNQSGGLVGVLNAGTIIENSYSTMNVSAASSPAGLVGDLIGGTISNSYSTGVVTDTDPSFPTLGGLVAVIQGTGSMITDSYSTSPLVGGATSTSGLIGALGGSATITNSYWDENTSGAPSSAGGAGELTANMMNQSTFSGWGFGSTWGIVNGQSYPYLLAFYPTTPTAISGVSKAPIVQTINLALNGSNYDTTETGANGSFYYLEGNNVITGANSTISGTPSVLVYIDSGTTLGNAVAIIPSSGASLSGMDIPTADTVTLGSSATATISPADMAAAENGLTANPDILYSVSGNNVTLGNATNPNVNFTTTATTTFPQSGNLISFGSSDITFNGPLSLASASQTLNGGTNGIITLSSIIGNGDALIIDNNNAGSTISGDISDLGSLTLNGTGTLTLSGTTNTINGATDITGGTLALNNAAGTTDFAGGLSGAGALTITNNTAEVGGSNSGYSGTITLDAGMLEVNNNNTDPLGTGNLVLNGGTLDALIPITTGLDNAFSVDGTVTFTGSDMTLLGAGTINPGDTMTINGTTITSTPALTIDNATLDGSGTAGFTGPITLSSATTDTIGANSGTFTITGNINGNANLDINGPGAVDMVGSIGSSTPLISIDSTNTTGEFTGSAYTSGDQTFGAPLLLSADATYNSTGGSITFNNTIDDGYNMDVTSNGATTFNGAVGSNAPLTSLTVNSSGTNINGGSVNTTGDQTYNELVTLGATTTITADDLYTNDGIMGDQNLNLDVINAVLTGPFAINTLNTNSNEPGTSNNIDIVNNSTENWIITGNGTGTLGGISGINNNVVFSNLTNLVGGTGNNTFTIEPGGSITGNIIGGNGTNTLVDENANNIWNINGVNTGKVTGVGDTFSNIQNLIGGSGGNTFIFANGAKITGTIDGGSLNSTNTLNFLAFNSQISVDPDTTLFAGKVFNSTGLVETYSDINNLIANGAFANPLNLPVNIPQSFVTLTGSFQGSIADPLTYSGFFVNLSFPIVSPIIQEPEFSPLPAISIPDASYQYLDDYANYLSSIKIDPWCFQHAEEQ